MTTASTENLLAKAFVVGLLGLGAWTVYTHASPKNKKLILPLFLLLPVIPP